MSRVFAVHLAARWPAALLAGLLVWPVAAAAPERYTATALLAAASDENQLQVTLSDGQSRLMGLDPAMPVSSGPQVAFDQPQISADGTRVGWLALYFAGGQSYPVPLALVIYRDGRVEARLQGNGQAIIQWRFDAVGGSVAFCQRPTHGAGPDHFVRQKIGRAAADEQLDVAEDAPASALPAWAADIRC